MSLVAGRKRTHRLIRSEAFFHTALVDAGYHQDELGSGTYFLGISVATLTLRDGGYVAAVDGREFRRVDALRRSLGV